MGDLIEVNFKKDDDRTDPCSVCPDFTKKKCKETCRKAEIFWINMAKKLIGKE